MLNIMKELEHIEEEAEKIAMKAEEEQGKLPLVIDEFKSRIMKEMNDYKLKTCNQLKADAVYATEKQLQAIQKEKEETIKKLEEVYLAQKELWIQDILKQIIGGDADVG